MSDDNCSGHFSGTNRLGACEVCSAATAKYTCPKCEVKTCSLHCNQNHKTELKCDGQRDRTKFIPLNKFTNLDLLSDYRFLEEINTRLESNKKKFGRAPKVYKPRPELPLHLVKLRSEAFKRRINYKFLPRHFDRHKNNRTWLHFKSNIIRWQIEWVFVNTDNLKLIDTDIPENVSLKSVIQKYFGTQENETLNEKLLFYQAVGQNGVRLLLKAEEKGLPKYYELDPSLPLSQCFSKKTIIEYPTIMVVMKEHVDGFDLIDSDAEQDFQNTNEDEYSNDNKNYLFPCDDVCDDE